MIKVKFNRYEVKYPVSSDNRESVPFVEIVDILSSIVALSLPDRRFQKVRRGKVIFLESFFESSHYGYYYGCFCSLSRKYRPAIVDMYNLSLLNEKDLQSVKQEGVRKRVYFYICAEPSCVMLFMQNPGNSFCVSDFQDYITYMCTRYLRDYQPGKFYLEHVLDLGYDSNILQMSNISKIEIDCSRDYLEPFFTGIGQTLSDFNDVVKVTVEPGKNREFQELFDDVVLSGFLDERKFPQVKRIKFYGRDEVGTKLVFDSAKPYSTTIISMCPNGASGELFSEYVYECFDSLIDPES